MRQFSDVELVALPEESLFVDRVEMRTDSTTGVTYRELIPRRFVPNDSEIVSFRDHQGVVWLVGKDENGYFKSRWESP